VWSHLQTLLRVRAERADLRTARMENLSVGDQVWVYRRGRTVVAINNGSTAATVTMPGLTVGTDVLKACSVSGTTLNIPARSSCVF
jgi:hypothetical protein